MVVNQIGRTIKTQDLHVVDGASVLAGVDAAEGELTVGDRLGGGRLEGNSNRGSGDRALLLEVVDDWRLRVRSISRSLQISPTGRNSRSGGGAESSLSQVNGANTSDSNASKQTRRA